MPKDVREETSATLRDASVAMLGPTKLQRSLGNGIENIFALMLGM